MFYNLRALPLNQLWVQLGSGPTIRTQPDEGLGHCGGRRARVGRCALQIRQRLEYTVKASIFTLVNAGYKYFTTTSSIFLNHLIKSSLEYLLYIEEKTTHSGKKLRLTYFFLKRFVSRMATKSSLCRQTAYHH